MKTLKFWVIALAVIILSSCGNRKEKITKENGVEILNQVLGYPYALTTSEKYSFYAKGDLGDALEESGFIRRGSGTRSYVPYKYFSSTDSLGSYSPFSAPIYDCDNYQLKSKICGAFLLTQEEIQAINNISEETDNGKVTIEFFISRKFSYFYYPFTRHPYNIPNIGSLLDDNETGSVVLQRGEEGWMLVERDDLKQDVMDKKGNAAYFRAYGISEFKNMQNLLNPLIAPR